VTLTGTGFTAIRNIWIGDTRVVSWTRQSGTRIAVTVPAAAQTRRIFVVTTFGWAVSPTRLTVTG
jgi:hypothetical protein